MGKQGRVMQRMAAVGAGVLLAGSMWTGTAAAQSTPNTGGIQCTALPLLIQQYNNLMQTIPVTIPGLPAGLPTDPTALLNLINSLIPGCSGTGGSTGVSNPPYAPHNPKPVGCYPAYKEGYPDHPGFNQGFYQGYDQTGSTSAPPSSASASSGTSSKGLDPAGVLGGGATDAATGQGLPLAAPAAVPAAVPQQQAAAPQAYAAQPQQSYVAGGQQPASYGSYGGGYQQQGYQQAPYNTSGAGAQGMYGQTPYGSSSGYDQSFAGYGGYGPPPAYGDDYGYGHDGYKNDRKGCYDKGKESSPKSYGKDDDHGHDYGQVSHVPDGSVNTGEGDSQLPLALVERTTG